MVSSISDISSIQRCSEQISLIMAGHADPLKEIMRRYDTAEDRGAFVLSLAFELLATRKRLMAYVHASRAKEARS